MAAVKEHLDKMIIAALLATLGTLELVTPWENPPEGMTDRGELPDELKQLFSLKAAKANEHNALVDQFKQLGSDDESDELQKKLDASYPIAEMVDRIFWFEVRAHFGIDSGDIYVAPDWHIYVDENEYPVCPGCGRRHPQRSTIGSTGSIFEAIFGPFEPPPATEEPEGEDAQTPFEARGTDKTVH